MSGPAILFRDIHRLRRLAHDTQEQLDRIPRQLKAHLAKVTRAEDQVRAVQEAIKHLKVTNHEKEVTLKTTHGQIAKYQRQINEAGSKKEYDALQLEIKHAQQRCRQLEDEILAGMAESEDRAAQLPELEKAVQQARQEYARSEQGAGARQADLAQQLNDTLRRLQEVEANVPANLLPQYHRIVTALGADALAPVRDRNCSACHNEITAQNYNDLQQEHVVVCKSCGRILYLPEEPVSLKRAAEVDE